MMKAKGRHAICLFFTFVPLLVPTSSHGWLRGVAQTPSPQDVRSARARDEKIAEQNLWDSIKGGSDPQEYKTFLAKYPLGQFKDEARARLVALLGEDYVALFTKRVSVNERWSEVERQLGRRAALIPALVESALAAGVQEQEMWGRIAAARSQLLNATNAAPLGEVGGKTPEQKRAVIEAYGRFGVTLGPLDSMLENHPHLRSNEVFMKPLYELEGVGNRINVARADYNRAVRDYNAARGRPRAAGAAERHGFTEEPYFNSEQGRPAEPKVMTVPDAGR
jgi:LemA protein